MSQVQKFPCSMTHFTPMMKWIEQMSKEAGCSFSQIHKVELAMEEALVNIIRYAYDGKGGTVEISCDMENGKWIQFVIMDMGKPFDPLEYTPQLQGPDLENLEEGGLGITIIKESMDQVEYERNKDLNILTLRKNLN